MNWFERRFLPLALLLPIAGIVFTFTELRYLAFAKVAEGTIVSIEPATRMVADGPRPNGQLITVGYIDTADRMEYFTQGRFHDLWKPEGVTIPVQFVPGDPESGRLLADSHPWIALSILSVALILAIMAVSFGLEANQPITRRR